MIEAPLPPVVYKYAGPERVGILENECIHFSKLSALNDPFEGRPFIEQISDDSERIATAVAENRRMIASGEADQLARTMYHEQVAAGRDPGMTEDEFVATVRANALAHAERDGEALVWENANFEGGRVERRVFADSVVATFDPHLGMLSLASSPSNPLMWAHYGSSHRGLCIGLASDHPFFHQEPAPDRKIGGLIKVAYYSKRPRTVWDKSDLSREEQEDDWITYFIQAKSDHWAYEEEYRIVRPLGSPLRDDDVSEEMKSTGFGSLFRLPTSAVVSVVLGMRAGAELEADVRALLSEPRYSHVRLQRADLDEEEYTIVVQDV